MPLRWGPRRSNVFQDNVDIHLEKEEEWTTVDPFQSFMEHIQTLRFQYRITDMEWALSISTTVQNKSEPMTREEYYTLKSILSSIHEYHTISRGVYREIYDFCGVRIINSIANDLAYYYPEYEEQTPPSYRTMWDALNRAIESDCVQEGLYFKHVSYRESDSELTTAMQDAFIPPDILHFCRGAKELALKCKDVSLAKDVIAEADRILHV